jgi:hypothetical protein
VTTGKGKPAQWTQIGKSQTSPVENKTRAEVALDNYYLVVGFEVNNPKAFVDGVHDLAVDYGHAFFYLVKNLIIEKVFSFGPAGAGKNGWFNKGGTFSRNAYNVGAIKKDGYTNSRAATADFAITEVVKAFQIPLTTSQARMLGEAVDKIRLEIEAGTVKYHAMVNDTCAETAKSLLDDADISTPSGSGWVKHSRMINFPVAYAINPYTWHKNFREKYQEKLYKADAIPGDWHPPVGESDPIFGAKQ